MNIYRVCGWICPERRESPVTRDVAAASRGTVPNRTVPYSTILYCAVGTHCISISYPVSLKESQGERKPLWKTGEIVENSVERLWKTGSAAGGAGAVWCRLAAGCVERAPVIGGHGVAWCAFAAGCVMAVVRCRARVQRRARWLAFLLREKFLDKLCKSILDWKWGKGPGPFTTGTAVRRSRRYPALPAQRSAARPRCRRGWRPRQRR